MDAIAGTIQGGEIVSRLIREENVDDIIKLEMIDSIPTAIDWIPVSERLPEEENL